MATVNKDFKIKYGLIVEGTDATVNGNQILTEDASDQYILDLVGGENLIDSVASGLSVDANSQLSIDRTVVDTWYDAAGDAADALTDANAYTDGRETAITTAYEAYADQAEVDAKAYTDTREIAITSAYESYADTAETDAKAYTDTREIAITSAYESYADTAEADAKSYADGIVGTVSGDLSTHESDTSTHGVTGDIVGTTDTQTLSNKTLGSDLAAGGYKVTGLLNPSANQDAATKSYVDTAVADLVNGAPELLDTLNELAAAIGDDENFITTVTASIGEKVAKAGDSMSGNLDFGGTSKVTSLAAPTNSGDAATKGYVDGEISTLDTAAQGYADDAETAANSYTDGRETAITTAYQNYADTAEADANSYTDGEITDALVTAQGYASDAQDNAQTFATNAINGLDTDDIEEGATNLYHTDARAKASAAALLTSASLTNIAITGNSTTGLIITAENGVADSDTDDLVEGSTNLYFTDVRAVDALEAVVPNFTAVELNSVAKEVAATATIATAGTATALSWAKADYKTAKALVKFATATHSEVSEILLTLDSSDNVAITEYAEIGTNGAMGTVTATVVGGDVRINVTTLNNATTVTVKATLLV